MRRLLEATARPRTGGATASTAVEAQRPAAPPSLAHPVLAALLQATDAPPRAKLGWTDVACLCRARYPAVNFGPGDPELAHTAGERVTRAELERVRRGPVGAPHVAPSVDQPHVVVWFVTGIVGFILAFGYLPSIRPRVRAFTQ